MQLYLFTSMLHDPTIQALVDFKSNPNRQAYFKAFPTLLEYSAKESITATPLWEYIIETAVNHSVHGAYLSTAMVEQYLTLDAETLYDFIFSTNWDELCKAVDLLPFPVGDAKQGEDSEYARAITSLCQSKSAHDISEGIRSFFTRYADANEARYSAFRWEQGELIGIKSIDDVSFDSLGGLEFQKQSLIENTRCFLEGKPSNNVLLVGSSGTGKSSCVKANLNLFKHQGLKMVELTKKDLTDLPDLMKVLRDKKQHYIIYVDDLSFGDADQTYIELKVALDGQLEPKPAHVLIYATSNRRRLMKENWSDRQGADDIHSSDTLHEKMSLSERFGIRLYFGVLSQEEYFDIIKLIFSEHDIPFTPELGIEAATWATTNNGRSGRTARQFANHYLSKML